MKVNIVIISLIFILVFSFLALSGILTSGYHFTDDHEIIRLTNELKTESTLSVTTHWINNDFNIRLRPMYYFHRIIEARMFGNNFTLWHVWTAILASATFSFFYLGMRKLMFSIPESLLFIILAFVGSQMAIWWRLGPAETIGVFFLGLAFYFMTNCRKQYTINTILFCLSLILSALCKESFTIIIPAFIVFKIWHEKICFNFSTKKAMIKNYLLVIPLILMGVILWLLIYVIGTNNIGYAGVTPGIWALAKGIISILRNPLFKFIAIVFLLLGSIYYEYKDEKKFVQFLLKLIPSAVFAILILIPNLIIYAKSGIFERYLLPSTIGIAFFIVSILRAINNDYRWLYKLLVIIILLVFLRHLNEICNSAVNFAKDGFYTNKLLSAIIQNSNEKSNVLLVANPANNYESSYSLNTYLSLFNNTRVYAYPINDVYKDDFSKGLSKDWNLWFEGKKSKDVTGNVDIIIFFDKNLNEQFFKESSVDSKRYVNLLSKENEYAAYGYK